MTSPARSADASGGYRPPSVLVITKDEQANITSCLDHLSFTDDIVILDSGSKDRTLELARARPNVRIVHRDFDAEHLQRNYGLHGIAWKNPWVYVCDADEWVEPELASEMMQAINDPAQQHVAYRLRYRNMFRGKWIRHASEYPVWVIRLVRPDGIRYEARQTNVHPIVDGTIGELRGHFEHYSFRKGLVAWLAKHNGYSEREASEGLLVRKTGRARLADLLVFDPIQRRRALKNLSFLLPGRGFMRFLVGYVFRGGLLDGVAGFRYCAMMSLYEFLIGAKMREREQQWRRRTDEIGARLLAGAAAPSQEEGSGGVDVLILTFDAASHIAEAVTNARQVGRVFVLDSGSTDGTQDLARAAGAVVVEHPWEGYARQTKWGLDHLPFTRKWLLILDANERVTPALRAELRAVVASHTPAAAYFINSLMLFMGQLIRHGGLYSPWSVRFFQRGSCRYQDRSTGDRIVCSGPTGYLRGQLLGIRRETVSEYIAKHIRDADLESDERVKMRLGQALTTTEPSVLVRGVQRQRRWRGPRVRPTLPFSPLLRFAYMYFLRLGFLDGRAGWQIAMLTASYEYMISLLYREKLARGRIDRSHAQSSPAGQRGLHHSRT